MRVLVFLGFSVWFDPLVTAFCYPQPLFSVLYWWHVNRRGNWNHRATEPSTATRAWTHLMQDDHRYQRTEIQCCHCQDWHVGLHLWPAAWRLMKIADCPLSCKPQSYLAFITISWFVSSVCALSMAVEKFVSVGIITGLAYVSVQPFISPLSKWICMRVWMQYRSFFYICLCVSPLVNGTLLMCWSTKSAGQFSAVTETSLDKGLCASDKRPKLSLVTVVKNSRASRRTPTVL